MLNDVTITFDLHQLLGDDFDARRTRAYVKTNVANQTLMDTSTGKVRMGDQKVTVGDDGTGSFTTWAPGPDGNPISWQTYLVVEYPRAGQRDRVTRTFGPWTITASGMLTDLEEEQAVPAEYLTQVTDELQTYVTAAEGHADDAAASATSAQAVRDGIVGDLGTTDSQTATLINSPGSLTETALTASYAGRDPGAPKMRGLAVYAVGTSWESGGWGDLTGGPYPDVFAADALATVVNRSEGGSRMGDHYARLVYDTDGPGSFLTVGFSGLVFLGDPINDINNATGLTGDTAHPEDLTAKRLTNWQSWLSASLAFASARQHIALDGSNGALTLSGTWANVPAQAAYTQNVYRTTQQNAYLETVVEVDASGVVYVILLQRSNVTMGVGQVSIDGTPVASTTAGTQHEAVTSAVTGVTYTSSPWACRIETTPGLHTIRVTKTDATTDPVDVDMCLPLSAHPAPILIPVAANAAVGAGLATQQQVDDAAAARVQFLASAREAAAYFPNSEVVDLDPLGTFDASGYHAADNIHYSNAGRAFILSELRVALDRLGRRKAVRDSLTPFGDPTPQVITATLAGSWVNFGASEWGAARFWKENDRDVRMVGLVTGGATSSTIFTLPPGYRPIYQRFVDAVLPGGDRGQILVTPAGVVSLDYTPAGGSPAFVDFNVSIPLV